MGFGAAASCNRKAPPLVVTGLDLCQRLTGIRVAAFLWADSGNAPQPAD